MSEFADKTIELIREHGILRSCDLKIHGIPQTYLSRLVKQGVIQRIGRGLYTLPEHEISEYQSLVEVSGIYLLPYGNISRTWRMSRTSLWDAVGLDVVTARLRQFLIPSAVAVRDGEEFLLQWNLNGYLEHATL